jgi:dipeptidyl aminopeptidase/acylaminoacyl peptidase
MDKYNQIRYDLLGIAFDPENCSFGTLDAIWSVSGKGKSISFPGISPDGKCLLFCLSNYGNFTMWHPESDLYLLDVTTGKTSEPEINSNDIESFYKWSSTGRWIVFSSRRGDGLYIRPYFSYFDSSGQPNKPFILPQNKGEILIDF